MAESIHKKILSKEKIFRHRNELSIAAGKGDVQQVCSLIERTGIDVNFANPTLSILLYAPVTPPLHAACKTGQVEVVKVLLTEYKHVDVDLVYQNQTPLSISSRGGFLEIMKLLLECGASAFYVESVVENPLVVAAYYGQYEAAVLLLQSSGASATINAIGTSAVYIDASGASYDRQTPLVAAAQGGHTNLVKLLLENGASVQEHFNRPLIVTCKRGHTECARLLIEWGAKVDDENELDTPLTCAVGNGHESCIQLLLESGADANKPNSSNQSPLTVACKNGYVSLVELLLENGADIKTLSADDFYYALIQACHIGHIHCVRSFVQSVVNVIEEPTGKRTDLVKVLSTSVLGVPPLLLACRIGQMEVVRSLLECKYIQVDISHREETPLSAAAKSGYVEIMKVLLSHGATVNYVEDSSAHNPLHAASGSGQYEAAKLLLECGADVNACIYKTPLMVAAENGHSNLVELLLENGAVVDSKIVSSMKLVVEKVVAYKDQNSAHALRRLSSYLNIVQLLLENGADVSTIQVSCLSATLLAACKIDHTVCVKRLLEGGANVNHHEIQSPLICAIEKRLTGCTQLLLEYGADFNRTNPFGDTPLMIALLNGDLDIAQLLQQYGADLSSTLLKECKNGRTDCVRLLVQYGVNVNGQQIDSAKFETDQGTPLTCAVEKDYTECTRLLLENGADVNKPNHWGYTPLMVATQNNNINCVRILLQYGANVNDTAYGDTALTLASSDHNFEITNLLIQYGAIKKNKLDNKSYEYLNLMWSDEETDESDSDQEGIESEEEAVDKSDTEDNKLDSDEDKDKGQDVKHLAAIEKAMQEKGILKHTLAHGVLAGPARSGKSSLMKRLTGEMPDSTSPSTGVAEQVVQVGVTCKHSYSIALGVYDSIWYKLLYDEEAIRLIKLASFTTPPPPPPPQPPASLKLTNSGVTTGTIPLESGTEHVLMPHHEEQESILSTVTHTTTASLFPVGYIAPMGVFKNAIRGKGLEGLREHFENSWSLYLTDTGGQIEFQELLPLLVSGPSIFFLTFCLHQDLNKRFTIEYHLPDGGRSEPYQSTLTVMESILQTLASIASMGTFTYKGPQRNTIQVKPKVFIVGTHKDLLDQDEVDTEIQGIDQHIQTAIKSTSHYQEDLVEFASKSQLIFTVNNLSEDVTDFVVIRAAVERVVNRSKFEISFPSNWLIFSLVLRQEMIEDSVISYDQCFAIARDCGITDYEELNHALQFLHTKIGLVRHFPIPDLHDIVIRYPQILFDMVTKLIVNTFTFENVSQRKLTEFEKKGIFTIEDLSQIEQFSVPLLTLEKFLKLVEHLRIIAPFEEDGKLKYFIPCVLAHSKQTESQSSPQSSNVPPLLITFKCGYCPKGLPCTLIKYLITNEMGSKFKWRLMTDQIFRDQVTFGVSPYDAITLKIHPTYLEVIHFRTSTPKQARKVATVCKKVRQSIESGIKQVSSDMKLSSYATHSLNFYCENPKCSLEEPHPATEICKDEDGSMCNLWCNKSGIVLQSPLPDHYSLWFGKEGGHRGHGGIPNSSLSPPHLDDAEHDVKDAEKRLQDIAVLDTHGQAPEISMAPLPQLSEVFKVLLPVASDWESIAVLLSIPHDRVKAIRQGNLLVANNCLHEMLNEWLNQTNPPPSWNTLAEAMELLNPAKAQEIRKNYMMS